MSASNGRGHGASGKGARGVRAGVAGWRETRSVGVGEERREGVGCGPARESTAVARARMGIHPYGLVQTRHSYRGAAMRMAE